MADKQNMSIITEQGDLGLGTRELSDKEQALVDEQQKRKRKEFNESCSKK
mgnify:CR=1 FL=1|jgi:hypothetical protein